MLMKRTGFGGNCANISETWAPGAMRDMSYLLILDHFH